MPFTLCRATVADVDEVAAEFSAPFRLLTFLPMLRTVAEDRSFIANVILKICEVVVAEDAGGIVSFPARHREEVRLFYTRPDRIARTRLIEAVKSREVNILELGAFRPTPARVASTKCGGSAQSASPAEPTTRRRHPTSVTGGNVPSLVDWSFWFRRPPTPDNPVGSRFEVRLRREIRGEVLFDAFSRGRYATDASLYQIEPLGVVVPKNREDAAAAIAIAREEGVPVVPRGGGTSQCGQTVARALVIDCSKHLDRVIAVDVEGRRARVEPGVVLDRLNRLLRKDKLFFPVDPSTASRATIGGMTANNSCGSRSLRYGNMVHNVRGIDALLADGTQAWFGEVPGNFDDSAMPERYRDLVRRMRALHRREADEIERWFPKVLRRVGGYNIDSVDDNGHNMARLLVGSEGTLAFFNEIELELQPIPAHRVLGICHFPSFYGAMAATQKIVELGPSAVELVDRTMSELSRDIPLFRPVVDRFVRGEPAAILLTEFAGEDPPENLCRLKALDELMGDLGLPGAVVEAVDPAFQSAVWEVRAQGLNIMMSMKGDGKPVSFLEDCAVRLEDLADYTDRLTRIFEKHGTYGTWYAHASVGCLHVRPVLNVKQELEVRKMRAIAEEAFAMVREYQGSHSGEHGDGLVRSEFHEQMFGAELVNAFAQVKHRFDPHNLFNPGKIVRAPKFDDRAYFRYGPGYRADTIATALDWSAYPGAGGGFQGAVEMCNNNGACRALAGGVMCPSYRATLDERDVTRGRANTLRLAITGQLGPDAL